MTPKAAERVDRLYRNLRQVPLLLLLSFLVPPLWLVTLPAGTVLWWQRRRTVRRHEDGDLSLGPADREPPRPGKPTTEQQLDYVLHEGGRWVRLIAVLALLAWLILCPVAVFVVGSNFS